MSQTVFFFNQFKRLEDYKKAMRNEVDPSDLEEIKNEVEKADIQPKELLIIVEKVQQLDIRELNDFLRGIQTLYSLIQSNDKYEIYEEMMIDHLMNGKNLMIDLERMKIVLTRDYQLLKEIAEKEKLLRTNTGLIIDKIEMKENIEINIRSGVYITLLALMLSKGETCHEKERNRMLIKFKGMEKALNEIIEIFKEDNDEREREKASLF